MSEDLLATRRQFFPKRRGANGGRLTPPPPVPRFDPDSENDPEGSDEPRLPRLNRPGQVTRLSVTGILVQVAENIKYLRGDGDARRLIQLEGEQFEAEYREACKGAPADIVKRFEAEHLSKEASEEKRLTLKVAFLLAQRGKSAKRWMMGRRNQQIVLGASGMERFAEALAEEQPKQKSDNPSVEFALPPDLHAKLDESQRISMASELRRAKPGQEGEVLLKYKAIAEQRGAKPA